jgi:hypothetical protein
MEFSGGTGNLVFGLTAASMINLNLTALDSLDAGVSKSYIIATKSSGATFTGFDSSIFSFQTNGFSVSSILIAANGNNLVITLTSVPEPGSILLISALSLGGVHFWRRRKGSAVEAPQAI